MPRQTFEWTWGSLGNRTHNSLHRHRQLSGLPRKGRGFVDKSRARATRNRLKMRRGSPGEIRPGHRSRCRPGGRTRMQSCHSSPSTTSWSADQAERRGNGTVQYRPATANAWRARLRRRQIKGPCSTYRPDEENANHRRAGDVPARRIRRKPKTGRWIRSEGGGSLSQAAFLGNRPGWKPASAYRRRCFQSSAPTSATPRGTSTVKTAECGRRSNFYRS